MVTLFGSSVLKRKGKVKRLVITNAKRISSKSGVGFGRGPRAKGIIYDNVTFTTKDDLLFQQIEKCLPDPETAEEAVYGSGPLAYIGSVSSDGGMFIGENAGLGSKMSRFIGVEGQEHLQKVAGALGERFNELKPTQVKYSYEFDASSTLGTMDQFTQACEQTLRAQQSTKPTLVIKHNVLAIGTKGSSSNFITISPLRSSRAGQVSGIQVEVTLTGATAETFTTTLTSGNTYNIGNIAASFMLEGVSKLNTSPLIELIRDTINKNFDLGSVVKLKKQSLLLNPAVRYAQSCMEAVKKRLQDPLISREVTTVLVSGLKEIILVGGLIPSYKELITGLNELVSNAPEKPSITPAVVLTPQQKAAATRARKKREAEEAAAKAAETKD